MYQASLSSQRSKEAKKKKINNAWSQVIIFLSKVTSCKSCLSKCNWFVVWLRMTSEFFHPLSHLLRKEKAVGRISLFPRSAIINGYFLSLSAILSYIPIVVQNEELKVTPSWFSALCKYIEMSSESLSTIRDNFFFFFFFLNCGCRWKWRMILAVNFPI